MTMQIEIAAYGWQGKEWDGYYPDDLPADWRLDYYANEQFAVVVPYADWADEEDETLLEWQEQVSDDFRFYWELPEGDEAALDRLQRLRQDDEFAAHWGGIVADVSTLRIEAPLELRPLREAMQQAMAPAAERLLVVVTASAAASLAAARDLGQLLGG